MTPVMKMLRRDAWQVDAAVSIVLVCALELECLFAQGVTAHDRIVTALASILFAAPVAVRRLVPDGALLLSCSVLVVQTLLGGQLLTGGLPNEPVLVVVLLLLTYAVGAWLDTARSLVTVAAALTLTCATEFLPGMGPIPTSTGGIASSSFYSSLLIVPGWFIGRLGRRHAQRGVAFRRLVTEASDEQATRQAATVAQERDRIGRELEDIITHSVSSMVVQAGGARLLLNSDPERARTSILNVEHTGREALADLRRLLGMLRKDDDARSLSPQPGLVQLNALVQSARKEGLTCELTMDSDQIDLTPGVDLVAYRAVEVAISSALRRGSTLVQVGVHCSADELNLEVRCNGGTSNLAGDLDAITDRVRLYDGTLQAVFTSNDELVVRLRLPLDSGVLA